jgi:soluble lytic murein transglycosylase-like protein
MGVTDIYDPRQNIEGGVKYMRLLLNMFDNDLVLALAGYNAGEGAVVKYGNQVPPYKETVDYVRRIMARYRSVSAR